MTATMTSPTYACTVKTSGDTVTVTSPKGNSVTLTSRQISLLPNDVAYALNNDFDLETGSKQLDLTKQEMQQILDASKVCTVAERTVKTMEVLTNGHNYQSSEEARIHKAEMGLAKVLKEDLHMLIYDIPTEMNSECPNPSPWLWRYGARINLSCWILPESSLNSLRVKKELALWERNHIEVHIIYQSKESQQKIREIAADKLAKEIARAHGSLIQRIDNADQTLKQALAQAEQEQSMSASDLTKKRDLAVRAIINTAAKSLSDCIACAEQFDLTGQVQDLLDALKKVTAAQAEAFNAVAKLKHIKPVAVPK